MPKYINLEVSHDEHQRIIEILNELPDTVAYEQPGTAKDYTSDSPRSSYVQDKRTSELYLLAYDCDVRTIKIKITPDHLVHCSKFISPFLTQFGDEDTACIFFNSRLWDTFPEVFFLQKVQGQYVLRGSLINPDDDMAERMSICFLNAGFREDNPELD